ncbi:hypothetical protein TTHERM_00301910 (macronuclear) [Tetrahymena thermophila SB210]|uniref:Uncharacterized protein n=1 Tax=Tetrahymena thermophila (strain SB210) TaxID=312017 RepID=I7MM88_TETTS|nr:hypothetical protein TTHERM_00301910 [Tetrahymena thermophila SB210]EAS04374.2 hypothetical protein TTHERM_00301910 [Tetrahymena thermophila SB210]|eukprot:XP_001024619.2 hypothetical protein TTHERM_00301910 [Tetrahymena thermophila SB210]
MIENFDKLIQQKDINTNPVLRETKVEFKNFQDGQGLYALFLEKYKVKENQPFVIERVPEDTDRSTMDKKNYYCIDIKQVPKNQTKLDVKSQVMRGYIVQNPRQSVFFSATKNQGFLFLSKPKGSKNIQLRPFLCGSVIKEKSDDPVQQKEDTIKRNQDSKEIDEINDKMKKVTKSRGKQPIEVFMRNPELIKNTKTRKEDSELYEDNDYKQSRKEDKEFKRKKRAQLESYEDGELDNEDQFNINEKDEEEFDE